MRKVPLRLLSAVGGVIAAWSSLPAQASAFTATALAVPAYSGSCPAVIPFKGTIVGKPGSDVTYAFMYFDPGQGKVVTGEAVSATIGSDGSLPIAGKGTLSGSGNAWAQAAVESPDPSFSNTVSFSVNCTASTHSGANALHGVATGAHSVAAAAAVPRRMSYILEFTIWTGSDDLRSDSFATVTAGSYSSGLLISDCLLKSDHEDSWQNNSKHRVPCPENTDVAPADLLGALKKSSIDIQLNRGGGPWDIITKTQDNWNIQRVLVQEYEPGSGKKPVCVFDVSGDPLKRLSGSEPSVTLTDYPSDC